MTVFPDNAWGTKNPCKAASTANLTLSGTQTVDGVALVAGDRCFVKDQTTGTQNGIYVVSAGAWTRAADANYSVQMPPGHVVPVAAGGTLNGGTSWENTNTSVVLLTTSLTYIRHDGANADAWTTTLNALGGLAASAAANDYVMSAVGGSHTLKTAATTAGSALIHLDPAQYAITGKTPRVRIVGHLHPPGAQTRNVTFSLSAVTYSATGVPTLGTQVVNTGVIAAPAAGSTAVAYSAQANMPAAGTYAIVATTSAAASATANSLQMRALLQNRVV
jgi:hypothetical protein